MRKSPRRRLSRNERRAFASEIALWEIDRLPEAWLWLRRHLHARRVFWEFDVDTLEWREL